MKDRAVIGKPSIEAEILEVSPVPSPDTELSSPQDLGRNEFQDPWSLSL